MNEQKNPLFDILDTLGKLPSSLLNARRERKERVREYHSPFTRNWERKRRNRTMKEIEDIYTNAVSQKKSSGGKTELSPEMTGRQVKKAQRKRSSTSTVEEGKSQSGPEISGRMMGRTQKNVPRSSVGGKSQSDPEIAGKTMNRAQGKRSGGSTKLPPNPTHEKSKVDGSLNLMETPATMRKTTTSPSVRKTAKNKSPVIRNTQAETTKDTKPSVQVPPKKPPQQSAPKKSVSKPFYPLRDAKDLDAYINSIIDDL